MTIPGVPGVVLGRSEHLAWAMTNLYVDDVDLFVEQLDVSGTKVQRGEEWVPILVENATIRLDDGEEVRFDIRSTDRGPLLEPDPVRGLPARSVAWSGYEPADQMLALTNLARARTIAEVPAAIAPYSSRRRIWWSGDRAGQHPVDADRPRAEPLRLGRPLPGAGLEERGRLGRSPAGRRQPGAHRSAGGGDRHRQQLPAGPAPAPGSRVSSTRRSAPIACASGWRRSATGRRPASPPCRATRPRCGRSGCVLPARQRSRRRCREGVAGALGLGRRDGRARCAGALRARRTAPASRRLPGRGDRRQAGALRHPLAADPAARGRDVDRLVRRRGDAGGREPRGDRRPRARRRLAGGREALGSGRRRVALRRHPSPAARPHPGLGAARRPPVQPRAVPARTVRRPPSWRSAARGSATSSTSTTARRCAW